MSADFTATFVARSLRLLAETVAPLAPQARVDLKPSPDNPRILHVSALDSGSVAIVKASLTGMCNRSGGIIGIDFASLLEKVKLLDSEESVQFSVDEKNLILKQGPFIRKLSLLDPVSVPVPRAQDLKPTAQGMVDLKSFERFLKMVNQTADWVQLWMKDGSLTMTTSADSGEDSFTDAKADHSGSAKAIYSRDYLATMVKALKNVDDEALLTFADDAALSLEAENEEGFNVQYILAPRTL
jgi:hypothetical protein